MMRIKNTIGEQIKEEMIDRKNEDMFRMYFAVRFYEQHNIVHVLRRHCEAMGRVVIKHIASLP